MIVWDLGGVLARFDPGARLTALADATALSPDVIDRAIWRSGLDAAAEQGRLDEEAVWSGVLVAVEHRIDRSELRRYWSQAFVPDPAVVSIIDRLDGPCALFTDNGPVLEACFGHELRALAVRFDHILLSCKLKATKSEVIAFHRAAALDAAPSQLTLIDDRATNVRAARSAGWRAIRFDRADDWERPSPTR